MTEVAAAADEADDDDDDDDAVFGREWPSGYSVARRFASGYEFEPRRRRK